MKYGTGIDRVLVDTQVCARTREHVAAQAELR